MKKRLLSLLLAACVMITFMPAANMEENTYAESEVFADDFVGFSADDETDVVGDSLDEEISEVEMVLGDEEDYGLVYEDVIPVETETASVAEGYSYAKVVVDTANVYADLYSEELLFQIAKDSVILVVDSEAAVRYSVAFNTADGVVEAFMASEDLKELDSDEVAAFYDAIALYDGAVLFNGNIDYPLANVEILEAAAVEQELTDDEALQIEGEDAEAEEQTDEEPVAMMPMRAMEALAATDIVITKQPEDLELELKATDYLTVEATGSNLSYQWQYKDASMEDWADTAVSGNKTSRLKLYGSVVHNNRQFRCVITDGSGKSITSDVATVTIAGLLTITKQPEDLELELKATGYLTVEATGSNLSYQWQYKDASMEDWADTAISGNKTNTLKVYGSMANNERQFRCVITDGTGKSIISDIATVRITRFTVNNVSYLILAGTGNIMVESFTGSDASLTIPTTVNGYTVTEIGECAFENNSTIQSVSLPNTITVIRRRAFAGCTNLSEMNNHD